MSGLCFVDTETTGLHPTRHVVWEVALITPSAIPGKWDEDVFMMRLTDEQVANADPIALDIGRFHERHPQGNTPGPLPQGVHYGLPDRIAPIVARLTHGKHLVGAVPSFDAQRLETLLHRYGIVPGWHYHLIDVEALTVGWVMAKYGVSDEAERQALTLPWKSDELSQCISVDPYEFDKHTALGDARWAKALYEAVMNP